jgi:glycosyltransferase involved in cell wall biosynthesis
MRIAVVTTHPIQYQVPWLQKLAARADIELQVYFAMIPDAVEQGREFGVAFEWDLPLLEGYPYKVMRNRARNPSLTHFRGCDTPEIYGEIRRGGYDAVIVNGWVVKSCLQALAACRLSGTPCIVRGEVNGLRPRAGWKRGLHRLLLSRYAAFLAIGSNNRQYYLDAGVPASRIFRTPYCVDNARFATGAAQARQAFSREQLCTRFGLDPARSTFLFSGKFVDKKRPADIIEALRRLSQADRDRAQLLLVGDGPLTASLRAAAVGLPVAFAGFLNQSEIAAAYAVSDCLVLPSDSGETWGLVVNEAMASGLPALVSDQVGCARDLVSLGQTGDVFACADVDGLASLLARYAPDRAALADMGRNARALVEADYNFDRVVEGVVSALGSLPEKTR